MESTVKIDKSDFLVKILHMNCFRLFVLKRFSNLPKIESISKILIWVPG